MIYALDKIAPGTANDDTLLYGVEVKFYNMEVAVDEHLETPYKGLYVIGDGSGITHSRGGCCPTPPPAASMSRVTLTMGGARCEGTISADNDTISTF